MAHPKQRTRRSDRALDLIDRKILSALRADGRLTTGQLAERVGLSASPCWTRVKRLEELGAIERYAAVLDHEALGLSDTVFVEITLDKHSEATLEAFGEALARIPEVVEAHLVSGDYDYLVKVAVADTSDYERFLRQRLYKIEGVRHTRSIFALRALKRAISVDPLLVRGGD
jgi:Lrp/AsnC family transcriptional regulator, leucine-responsive regulatory protein